MQHNKRLGGRKAKQEGKGFEQFVDRQAAKQGYVVVKIADGCIRVGKNKLVQVRQPFDRAYCKDGISIFCDLKSYAQSTLSYSNCVSFKHQIDALYAIEIQRIYAGFIVYLRELQKIYFFKASDLRQLQENSSLNVGLGIELGDIFTVDLGKVSNPYSDFWHSLEVVQHRPD